MKASQARSWFRTFMDAAPDVYFRYRLRPGRRFDYLSPAVEALTNCRADAFYADPRLCIGLIAADDRRALRQLLRARRARTVAVRLLQANGSARVLELQTVAVVRRRRIVAVEGVARLASSTTVHTPGLSAFSRTDAEPTQQRLTALMYEVHDILHRTLPPLAAATAASSDALRFGDLVLDNERLVATESGKPVNLTGRELLVLRYLLQRIGRIVTRKQLLTDVWSYSYTGDDRTVDVHISRLRRKLPSLRDRLVAVKHVGYRLETAEDVSTAAS